MMLRRKKNKGPGKCVTYLKVNFCPKSVVNDRNAPSVPVAIISSTILMTTKSTWFELPKCRKNWEIALDYINLNEDKT